MRVHSVLRLASRFSLRLAAPGFFEGAGTRRSGTTGPGTTFAGHREYCPGDDIRSVDWNVVARHNRPFVKLFDRDRVSAMVSVIDGSASMRSPDKRKWDVALEAAALLSLVAAREGDAVGAVIVTTRVEAVRGPRSGRRHALLLVQWLQECRPNGRGTALHLGIEQGLRFLRRPGVVVVISDFLHDQWESALRRAARTHTVVGIRVVSPIEQRLPRGGLIRVCDSETGHPTWVDTGSGAVLEAYRQQAETASRTCRARLVNTGAIPAEIVVTDRTFSGLRPICTSRCG